MITELDTIVRQLRWEAAGVVSVELADPRGGPLPPWRPGAHIELVLPTGIARQYSLCGSPEDRSCYRIGVLRERASRGGSEYVHAFLRPGQPVRVRAPRDNFGFSRAAAHLFVAGGIGITPILPMVHQAAEWGVPWHLLYGGRRAASMAFLDELRPYGDHVSVYPEDEAGLIPLDEWLGQPREDTDVYACGPEPLLTAVEKACAHWRPGALHLERFRPRPKPPRPDTAVEVVCARSNRTVTVPPDRSILGALQDAGLPVAGSCREGVCGTCETRVLEGVPEHRDDILSEQDRAAGDRMYLCVSRAVSPRLVLDV
ncbi:ferredoxin-NADP reductase [Amycolatopsis bartoniae]|uniref:Putative oxidoreductase n=1 Tax=Amycolatopsis bartoniae TaxID=941986 RepID=A0A8H9IV27_9PSEU|nr:PDR/VanB family oxidoreductase [Amycolatopsis bartoniae]MBB2936461.1 ferredoxin-NADP reductase [Amycolatopsis bartoniae]TVT11054.1 oxidoreductase [Amycolatopsis bartoniae]GHF68778.1 putative oxidoreductase [Amycolatopsis bartoniae]